MNEKEIVLLNKILDEGSFFPQKERKSREQRLDELMLWYDKYAEINEFYNVWGLDCVDSTDNDIWLDHGILRKQRYEINSKFICDGDVFPTNYTAITRDKSMFEAFAEQTLGDSTKFVKSYAFFKGYHFQSQEGDYETRKQDTFEAFIKRHEGETLIIKKATGCSGCVVYVCKIKNGKIIRDKEYSPQEYMDSLLSATATWMLQPFVKQHEFMEKLNADAVNIIRIVTFNTGKRVFAVPAMLVYARNDTEVCNSDQGSYCDGISMGGVIEEKALDWFGGRYVQCPVGGERIPYYDEVKELVLTLHKALPQLFTIGWDVALTSNGPLVFEGNDGWCPYVNEWSPETALRPTWNMAVEERNNYYKMF